MSDQLTAVAIAALFCGLVAAWGFSREVQRLVDRVLWRRDQRHAKTELAAFRDLYARLGAEAVERRAVEGYTRWLGDLAGAAEEIAALPEIEPERVLPWS